MKNILKKKLKIIFNLVLLFINLSKIIKQNMNIDLKKIIEDNDLKVKEVAIELFPQNKYPKLALDRILKGETFLDTNQLSKLSLMTNIPIQLLYSGGEWKTTATSNLIKFSSGDYKAELDTKKWLTKVYHKNSLFHESILHTGAIELSMYLGKISEIINKHNKK